MRISPFIFMDAGLYIQNISDRLVCRLNWKTASPRRMRGRTMKRSVVVLWGLQCLLLACSEKMPEAVYVRDDLFSQSLTIGISQQVIAVDSWYELSAQRKTGPWKKIGRSDLPKGQCWIVRPPPEKEEGVTNNVKWVCEPANHVEYSIPQNPFTEPRKVKFKAAGRYRLKAVSASWCAEPFESNIIEIEVR